MNSFYFRKIALTFMSCILFFLNHAQQTPFKNSKLSRKEIKEQRINKQFYDTKVLLSSESVVFEADFFKAYGTPKFSINQVFNFIQIDQQYITLQLSPIRGFSTNGLGGITLKSKISKHDLKINKKRKSFILKVGFSSINYGYFDVFFRINSKGRTTVSVDYNNGSHFTLYGHIFGPKKANIIKGLD